MKITILGANGWYSTETSSAICTLVETRNYYVILDAGESFYKLNDYITKDLPVFLFLSHLHWDHIYGLHILARMNFLKRLSIVVPEDKLTDLKRVAGSPFTVSVESIVKKIFPAPVGEVKKLPFGCQSLKLQHQDFSLGYRLTLDEKILAYCCDTAYCDNAITLARECDLLIHECTNKPMDVDGGWGHASPEDCARVAESAKAKKLILTHFMPDNYPDKASRISAQTVARKIFKNSLAAFDGMTVKI